MRSAVLEFTNEKVTLSFIAHKGYGRKRPGMSNPKMSNQLLKFERYHTIHVECLIRNRKQQHSV